jgi:hypothetical protein
MTSSLTAKQLSDALSSLAHRVSFMQATGTECV